MKSIAPGADQLTETSTPQALRFLDGGGEMGAMIRAYRWSETRLGPPEGWPSALKTLVGVMLGANQPMFTSWGTDERTLFYNDAYSVLLAQKHPGALGRSFRNVWIEVADDLDPLFDRVHAGEAIHMNDIELMIEREGGPQEAHFAFSYTPVRGETGGVDGLFCACTETTEEVLAERRHQAERERYATLFADAPGFICILRGPEHRYEFVNKAYRRVAGERDYVGRTVREVFPDLEGQGVYETLDKVFASGETTNIEGIRLRLQDSPDADEREMILDYVYQPLFEDGRVTGIFLEGQDRTEAYVTQLALRESEARFRAAVDAVHGVLWTNSPDGEMLGEQPGWHALTGQTREEYEGYGWADAVHPDDARPTIGAWNIAVAERRPFEFEHRVTRHDGEWRTYAIRAVPTFGDDGDIREWIGVHTDITDERAVQARLRESEENYRFAVELHPQVTWTATPDGQLDRVAERWREWTGTSGLGSSWGDGLHPDDLGYSTDAWVHSVTTGEPYDVEHRVKRIDGRFRWARSRAFARRDDAGAIVKWYGSTEDIDDRRVAEIKAFEAARELRGVVDALPGFVWTADLGGLIEYTSPMWHAYSGSTPEQSLGTGWASFVHPDDQAAAFDQWARSLDSGEPYEVEFRLRAADGTFHWWLARARKQPESGRWIGTATELDAIVAARDTLARSREQLEIEVEARTNELRETEEQLRQSQKLEAIGQLTGGVAHDFNNLLTVIRSSVDLLQRPGITEERRDRYIEAISSTVTRAAKLTGQLLAFARRQALQPVVFDVGAAIGDVTDMLGTLTGAAIRIDRNLPDGPRYALADPSQFDTALVNIVVNARDAMDGQGTLAITVAHAEGIPPTRTHPAVTGKFVTVAVADTGTGIDPDMLDQIFEPFYTTKGIGQGTGLGLSQVYGFAKQTGGEIRVTSTPGEGATFTLYLPRAEALADDEERGRTAPAAVNDGIRVLIVEDNPEVGAFAESTLTELGFVTRYVDGGAAALALLKESADAIDVVFSDVMMPGMNGVDLAKEIGRRHAGLPVVLTSGYSHVLAQHGSAGFALLQKPYSIDELSAMLSTAARKPS